MYYVFSFSIQRDKWTFQEMNLTMHKRRIRTAGVQPPSLTLAWYMWLLHTVPISYRNSI